jgi:GNAT superfamily N-acetyltransferase
VSGGSLIREATADDLPGITHVRTSVRENRLTREQLEARDITEASIATAFLADSKGWVAEEDGEIVAFSIADRKAASVFALFVLPEHEGRGLGSALLDRALRWLEENGVERVWLTTAEGTDAAAFYTARGWQAVGREQNDQIRFERTLG